MAYTKEEKEFILANAKKMTHLEMAKELNRTASGIKRFMRVNGLADIPSPIRKYNDDTYRNPCTPCIYCMPNFRCRILRESVRENPKNQGCKYRIVTWERDEPTQRKML